MASLLLFGELTPEYAIVLNDPWGSSGVTDHGALTGLADDDHTQYALLAGRSGGQTLTGGTAASNNLVLRSSSNGTKGQVYIDETTANTNSTTGALRVGGGVAITGRTYLGGGAMFASTLLPSSPNAIDIGTSAAQVRSIQTARKQGWFSPDGTSFNGSGGVYVTNDTCNWQLFLTGTATNCYFNNVPSAGLSDFTNDTLAAIYSDSGQGKILNNGAGSVIIGGTATFVNSDSGSIATLEANNDASVIIGQATAGFGGAGAGNRCFGTMTSSGQGSFLVGKVNAYESFSGNENASMTASGNGAVLMGFAHTSTSGGVATMISSGDGSFCHGEVVRGLIEATARGSFVNASVDAGNNTATAKASGQGSFVNGTIVSGGTGSITASGAGSFAAGGLTSSGSITSSSTGSFAFGYTTSATSIVASASNAAQFGPGTNSTASSVQFGSTFRFDWAASPALLNMPTGTSFVLDTTTGLKIGTATNQKLGFYNATPVVQYNTTGTATGFTAGAGTTVTHLSTFTGNSGATAYTLGDIVLALKTLGLIAA